MLVCDRGDFLITVGDCSTELLLIIVRCSSISKDLRRRYIVANATLAVPTTAVP